MFALSLALGSCAGPGGADTGALDDTEAVQDPEATDCLRIGSFSGTMLHPDGSAPDSRSFSLCGSTCENFEEAIEDDGTFSVLPEDCWYDDPRYPRPVFWFHGLTHAASLFYDFVPEYIGEDPMYIDSVVLPDPLYTPRVAAMELAEVTSGYLADTQGFSLTWDPEGVEFPLGHGDSRIGALRVDEQHWPPIPALSDLSVLYAVYPDETTFDPAAGLTLPAAGLAPGTRVEIVAIGNFEQTGAALAGVPSVVGEGMVSEDGGRVVASTDVDVLRWIGHRPVDE